MSTTPCTHEILPLTAPLAMRCPDCDQLAPYVPEPAREPIVLTGTGAMFKSEYDALLSQRVVVSVEIGPATGSYGSATATAVLSDGSTQDVLSWYDDELFFSKDEFIGKTEKQIREMFHEKDIAYIQS